MTDLDQTIAALERARGTLEALGKDLAVGFPLTAAETKADAALLDALARAMREGFHICRACRQTGAWHCSDPINCGGMRHLVLPWPAP